ncbi:MAG: hypothetical protein GWP14_08515 [Actinobacteria bacterium]|nr:hypothetical protein [Actinomycetota bacterium]
MSRSDGRRADQLRPTKIIRGFTELAPGSVLICQGRTRVLCTACWESGVPKFLAGSGRGCGLQPSMICSLRPPDSDAEGTVVTAKSMADPRRFKGS